MVNCFSSKSVVAIYYTTFVQKCQCTFSLRRQIFCRFLFFSFSFSCSCRILSAKHRLFRCEAAGVFSPEDQSPPTALLPLFPAIRKPLPVKRQGLLSAASHKFVRRLLLDGHILAGTPGGVIGLAAHLLIGADADVVLLALAQLLDGGAGGLCLFHRDRLGTLEVFRSRIL